MSIEFGIEYLSAVILALTPIDGSAERHFRIAAAHPLGDASYMNPFSPSAMKSTNALPSGHATGRPHAIASIIARHCASYTDDDTAASAAA
jgi:hypothetical protein